MNLTCAPPGLLLDFMTLNPTQITIAYAEDHRMFREAICSLFNPNFAVG
ncbi:MAG: hypothetical protein JST06_01795 [Bacteroidetes bacterium]|nr:hypothetical protein [Bacteroidota bacterium]